MKKGLLTIGAFVALAFTTTLNAQIITNGDFEAAMTANPAFGAGNFTTTGFASLFGSAETVTQHGGAQAMKLTTSNSPSLNTLLTWGDDNITGLLIHSYKGAISNPSALNLNLWYKYTPVTGDSAWIEVALYDTLLAGSTDDVLRYAGAIELITAVSAWTNGDIPMTVVAAGVVNKFSFTAMSSESGYYNARTPGVGSTLWLDDMTLGFTGVNEIENTITSSVYPNPAIDELNFKGMENISTVEIVSLDGKVISSNSVTGTSFSVNVAELTTGMYMYKMIDANGSITSHTFVKK